MAVGEETKLDEVDRKGANDLKEEVESRTDDMDNGCDGVPKEKNEKLDEVDRKGANDMKEEVESRTDDMDNGCDGVPKEQNEKLDEVDRKGANDMKEEVDSRTYDMDNGCDGTPEEQNEKRDAVDKKGVDDKKEEVGSRTGEWFYLTGSCSLVLHRGDITKWFKDGKTDAIVNAANEMMLGGGGVDGAIHRAAGRKLLDACFKSPEVARGVRCPIGSAVITPGFRLPVAQVIHTVGPMYHKEEDPAGILGKAYKRSIALAKKSGVKYVAFPAISCGIYGYPYEEAAKVSIQALQESAGDLLEVHFVLFEEGTYGAWLAYAEENLDRLPA